MLITETRTISRPRLTCYYRPLFVSRDSLKSTVETYQMVPPGCPPAFASIEVMRGHQKNSKSAGTTLGPYSGGGGITSTTPADAFCISHLKVNCNTNYIKNYGPGNLSVVYGAMARAARRNASSGHRRNGVTKSAATASESHRMAASLHSS